MHVLYIISQKAWLNLSSMIMNQSGIVCLLIMLFLLHNLILGMEGIVPSNPFLCGFSNRVYIFGCSMENLFATYMYMKGVWAYVGGGGGYMNNR